MTRTKVWTADPSNCQEDNLAEAALLLQQGAVVAFPTETVYGLGADARNSAAVARIFEAKGRPSDNPLIVHIASQTQLEELVLPYSQLVQKLMDAFWPGPLTIVLPVRSNRLSPLVTAQLPTVGVRIPDHPVALSLLRKADCPVAAPSANRSGKPSPTAAEHVISDLTGRIDGVVDGGVTGVGLESTVIEVAEDDTVTILRPGGVTEEELRAAAGDARIKSALTVIDEAAAPRSPGMKYTHYAPDGQLQLVQGEQSSVMAYMQSEVDAARKRGEKTALLVFEENTGLVHADCIASLGSREQLQEGAHRLYAALRYFDQEGIERIWSECCSRQGIGEALMNRLLKAAGNNVFHV
ncbi:L-threonylcarbamoyladenylate synthase [Paenibacillus sp. GXUN7292]|uniref:L-threonylcarbamoyladenylate synthase n=1 Tax=Paenibacillus sp. GXUN7292 TaxID=3422499 RepID=UPI003D7C9F9A